MTKDIINIEAEIAMMNESESNCSEKKEEEAKLFTDTIPQLDGNKDTEVPK